VPPLAPDAVHLWWAAGGPAAPRQRRARSDALLRSVLAGYLAMPPAALRFGREPRGRPFLLDADGQPRGPQFNLSDTRGGTVVAVASALRVGVDLERTDRRPAHRELAPRWFTPAEAAALAALPEDDARQAFLYLWTAKEASCKATGTGIYGRLQRWQFAVAGGDPRLAEAPEEAGDGSGWSFRRLAPAPGYTAVVACRGRISQVLAFALPLPPA
jgi:4'-phosphopantetheinyl transferase